MDSIAKERYNPIFSFRLERKKSPSNSNVRFAKMLEILKDYFSASVLQLILRGLL